MTERVTNEDILAAMDELFEALGTTNAAVAALHKRLDRQREVALETLRHCERLVKKDADMMRSMGIYGLVQRANSCVPDQDSAPAKGAFDKLAAELAPRLRRL